ncbi:hypothetical protein [Odoribacter lunatus]|nr:hypothetical protein [Odoribacter lunatus]
MKKRIFNGKKRVARNVSPQILEVASLCRRITFADYLLLRKAGGGRS